MPLLLGGRYRLDALIGGGGMGEVWQAHDEVLNRAVAVKVIRPHLAEDANVRARLRVEAQLAGSLHHPGIVDVFDYGEDEQDGRPVPYLVMPLIDGAPLSAVLAERTLLTTGETMAVVSEVASALQAAHDAGIVHRDLKPGNILVTPDARVLLVDFGIAQGSGGEPLTRTGTLVGTADYLSPEQARGRTATPASDLYALGVVAFVCLAGALPFHRDTEVATAMAHLHDAPPAMPESVPPEVSELVAALLAKDPAGRPESALTVATDAAAFATNVPTPPGAEPSLDGEPTMPDAEARPEESLPGIVERAVTVGAGEVAAPATMIAPAAATPATPAATAALATPDPATAPGHDDGVPAAAPPPPTTPARRGRPRRLWPIGVAAFLLLGVLGWLLFMRGGEQVVVPDVEGKSQNAARTLLEEKGFEVSVSSVDVAGRDRGEVADQEPAAGDRVDEGSVVTLSVASGRVKVPTDRLVGSTYDDAAKLLDRLGLEPERVDEPSSEPADTVLAADPSGTVKIGSTISLTVAVGAPDDLGTEDPGTDDSDDDEKGKNGKDKKDKKNEDGAGTGAEPAEPTSNPTTPQPTASATPPSPSPSATP